MPKRKSQAVAEVQADKGEEREEEGTSFSSAETSEESGSDDDSTLGDDSSSEEESEDDDDGVAFDSVTVDFDFSEPGDDDYHGIKAVLRNYLDGAQYNDSRVVDLIIQHHELATAVRCDGTVMGVTAALPITNGQHGFDKIRDYVGKRVAAEERPRVLEAFASKHTGLLISERLINCPPALGPPLLRMLIEALKAHGAKSSCRQLLLLARVFTATGQAISGGKGKKTASGAGRKQQNQEELIFTQPEVECMYGLASWKVEFPTHQEGKPSRQGELQLVRVLMMIPCSKLPEALKRVEHLLASFPEVPL